MSPFSVTASSFACWLPLSVGTLANNNSLKGMGLAINEGRVTEVRHKATAYWRQLPNQRKPEALRSQWQRVRKRGREWGKISGKRLHFHCKSHNGNNKEIACEKPPATANDEAKTKQGTLRRRQANWVKEGARDTERWRAWERVREWENQRKSSSFIVLSSCCGCRLFMNCKSCTTHQHTPTHTHTHISIEQNNTLQKKESEVEHEAEAEIEDGDGDGEGKQQQFQLYANAFWGHFKGVEYWSQRQAQILLAALVFFPLPFPLNSCSRDESCRFKVSQFLVVLARNRSRPHCSTFGHISNCISLSRTAEATGDGQEFCQWQLILASIGCWQCCITYSDSDSDFDAECHMQHSGLASMFCLMFDVCVPLTVCDFI